MAVTNAEYSSFFQYFPSFTGPGSNDSFYIRKGVTLALEDAKNLKQSSQTPQHLNWNYTIVLQYEKLYIKSSMEQTHQNCLYFFVVEHCGYRNSLAYFPPLE